MLLNITLTEVAPLQATTINLPPDILAQILVFILLLGIMKAFFTAEQVADTAITLPPTAIVTRWVNSKWGRPGSRFKWLLLAGQVVAVILIIYLILLGELPTLAESISLAALAWGAATAIGGLVAAQRPFRTRVADIINGEVADEELSSPCSPYEFKNDTDERIAKLQFIFAVLCPLCVGFVSNSILLLSLFLLTLVAAFGTGNWIYRYKVSTLDSNEPEECTPANKTAETEQTSEPADS